MRFSTSAVVSSTILSSVYAATWQVTVGANNALTFIPSVVKANVGDMVQFNFVSQNHTATSGDATQGCTPDGKFNSGFVPAACAGCPNPAASAAATPPAKKAKKAKKSLKKAKKAKKAKKGKKAKAAATSTAAAAAAATGTPPSFTVAITDTQPIAVYCAQAAHCQMGMVMVINPAANGTSSLAQYQQLSIAAGANIIPQGGPSGGTLANTVAGT